METGEDTQPDRLRGLERRGIGPCVYGKSASTRCECGILGGQRGHRSGGDRDLTGWIYTSVPMRAENVEKAAGLLEAGGPGAYPREDKRGANVAQNAVGLKPAGGRAGSAAVKRAVDPS